MSLIDWSDPENLLDMLLEFVTDAKTESHGKVRRQRFLDYLVANLTAAQQRVSSDDLLETITQLRRIYDSIDPEYQEDPVVDHIKACTEELERIASLAGESDSESAV